MNAFIVIYVAAGALSGFLYGLRRGAHIERNRATNFKAEKWNNLTLVVREIARLGREHERWQERKDQLEDTL